MDCTLAALIACFSWSGFYLDTGISYQSCGTGSPNTRTAFTIRMSTWL
jgi:hypothetical protein